MDLSTTYLGFKLPHPVMPGASPLVDDLDTVKRLEDAGAAAIVMHSLFEEQIAQEQLGHLMDVEMHEDAFVVWDTSRDEKATLWGGVMTATAKSKKVRAAAIDGGIRDTHQILEQDFPVYYRYRTSNGSLGRCQITH